MTDNQDPLPRALARIEELQRELAAARRVMREDCNTSAARAEAAEAKLQALSQSNLWLGKQLERIDDWLGEQDVGGTLPLPWQEELRDILSTPRPNHVGPPEMVHAVFHWRDRERPDGLSDALPGDGFGFAEYVEDFGLRMQFDCAGVMACADLSLDALKHTLAKEGFSVWPMVCAETEGFTDPIVRDMRTRIATLERELKSTTAENERLMDRAYGAGDERDHVQIAVDRAAALKVGDTFRMVPTIAVTKTVEDNMPRALIVTLPLPGFPGHAGALHEMMACFDVWGIKLPKQGDNDGNR